MAQKLEEEYDRLHGVTGVVMRKIVKNAGNLLCSLVDTCIAYVHVRFRPA